MFRRVLWEHLRAQCEYSLGFFSVLKSSIDIVSIWTWWHNQLLLGKCWKLHTLYDCRSAISSWSSLSKNPEGWKDADQSPVNPRYKFECLGIYLLCPWQRPQLPGVWRIYLVLRYSTLLCAPKVCFGEDPWSDSAFCVTADFHWLRPGTSMLPIASHHLETRWCTLPGGSFCFAFVDADFCWKRIAYRRPPIGLEHAHKAEPGAMRWWCVRHEFLDVRKSSRSMPMAGFGDYLPKLFGHVWPPQFLSRDQPGDIDRQKNF